MSILLSVLAVLLLVAAVGLRGREGSRGPQVGLAVASLAVVALATLSRPGSPQEQLREFEEVAGYGLGEMVMEASEGKGPILVLRSASDLQSDEPTAIRFRGLRKACSGHALIEAGPDPSGLGPPANGFEILEGEQWFEQVAAWSRQHPDAVAVVSLLFEFPDLADTWAEDLPPLYGFAAGPPENWVRAMRGGWLKAVVRYRPHSNPNSAPPRGASRQEMFDLRFERLTRETAEEALGMRP